VAWESRNTDRATVTKDGLVTAVSAGTTEIIIESMFNKITGVCELTILPRIGTAEELILAVRGTSPAITLTGDIKITMADMDKFDWERFVISQPKALNGGGYTLDLSELAPTSIDGATGYGVIFFKSDANGSRLNDIKIKLNAIYNGKTEKAVEAGNGITVTSTDVTYIL